MWPVTSKGFKAQSLTHFSLLIVMLKFVMLQSRNISVGSIDLVFVTELAIVILFVASIQAL